jgi:hypothetical protein
VRARGRPPGTRPAEPYDAALAGRGTARQYGLRDPFDPVAAIDAQAHLPFAVPDSTSLPEPDVVVVDHVAGRVAHPRTALLVIEVADSSLHVDTAIKPALYAAAGVPEYWVVDVRRRRVQVFSTPLDRQYSATDLFEGSALPAPTSVDVTPLVLDDLFAVV